MVAVILNFKLTNRGDFFHKLCNIYATMSYHAMKLSHMINSITMVHRKITNIKQSFIFSSCKYFSAKMSFCRELLNNPLLIACFMYWLNLLPLSAQIYFTGLLLTTYYKHVLMMTYCILYCTV